jgi:DNA-binding beta-propeller fold protein YncE
LSVVDISKPDAPRITATIPLINSVVGPPTNLAIHPSGDFALVANSLEPVTQGWGHRLEPDNKVFLIDLKTSPPSVIGTITVGKQPSGMAISPNGGLALVANRRRHGLGPRQGHPCRRYRDGRSARRQRLGRGNNPRRQTRACSQGCRQQNRSVVDRRHKGE